MALKKKDEVVLGIVGEGLLCNTQFFGRLINTINNEMRNGF
jgi:hypothetical protein